MTIIGKDGENRTMTDTSTLVFIAASVGIALACLHCSLLHRQENRLLWQRPGNCVRWTGMSLLLMILSACGGSSTFSPSVPPTITPMALTTTAHHGATPTEASLSSTDWTTYHRDNQRTGYVASTPD